MAFKAVLRVNMLVMASLLSVLFYTHCVNAQWLTLNNPQQAPLDNGTANDPRVMSYEQIVNKKFATMNHEKAHVGREAFNALGCGECHGDLADSSYQSGFRLLDELVDTNDALQVSANTLHAWQDRLFSARSLSPERSQQPLKEVVLGGETFVVSTLYSSLYLRKIHRSFSGSSWQQAQKSVNAFDTSSQARKAATIDYMLMF